MRKVISIIFVIQFLIFPIPAQKKIREAFSVGEKLTYRVAFSSLLTGSITAGNATLEVLPDNTRKNSFHIAARGGTHGFIELFFKIQYQFDSYISDETLLPFQFYSKKRENRYRKNDTLIFNHQQKTVSHSSGKAKIPPSTHDILSAFYFARTQDISGMKKGNYIQIPFFMDDSVYYSRIVYQGKETIKTKKGKVNCVVFKPMVATGRVFDEDFPVTMWLTDDPKKIPVLIEIKLSVGKVKVEKID